MCSRLEYIVTIPFVRPYPNLLTLYVQYTQTLAVKKWLPFQLIFAGYLEYIVTIYFVWPYSNLLSLYVQYTKTLAVKKWLLFELICSVYLKYIITIHLVCPYPNLLTLYVQWYISWTDLICSVHQEPSRQKVASIWTYMWSILRVHSNHSFCPSIPQFTDLICSVHQDPSRQKVASIWAYLCSILKVHSNHSLCPSISKSTDLYAKTLAVKKWIPFELICSVYLELIVTIHFVRPYPNLLNLYVQWYMLWTDLICTVHKEPSCQKVACLCSILRVHSNHSLCPPIPKLTDLICSVHQDPSLKKLASVWAYMCSIHSNLKQLTL